LLESGRRITSAAEKVRTNNPCSTVGLPHSTQIDTLVPLVVKYRKEHDYVSRAGIKLAHAVVHFDLANSLVGRTCIDVGSSHGGFTDVLLRHNVSKIYAVDVGYGLLDWR
jgi:23S rRNA (cytidine1920-2'-O)/16S rRNA (cytidine1409-2'-O)-methyltransferase